MVFLWIRGQSNDYDNWRQQGNTGWGWDDVLPYFLKSENNELGNTEFHNDKGPITVSNKQINLDMLEEFQNAAEETGIPRTKILIQEIILVLVIFNLLLVEINY